MKEVRTTHKRLSNSPNIILIVIDALRAGSLGCYGGPDPTPHIDRLAEEGIRFENAFASWNTTDQSLTSIFSGRYPRTHGIVRHGDKIRDLDLRNFRSLKVSMLAEILKQQGYATYAVDWMGRWFKRGFDYYGYKPQRSFPGRLAYHITTLPYLHLKYVIDNISLLRLYAGKRRVTLRKQIQTFRDVMRTFRFTFELARIQDAEQVVKRARELITRLDKQPFFLFLHFWDTHTPYNAPHRRIQDGAKSRDPRSLLRQKYQGAVRYTDKQIGRLVDFMKLKNLQENTLWIVTSDHGESLDEHEIFFDHHGLYDVTIHVPLLLYGPRLLLRAGTIKDFVQHIDLVPTLCHLLDIDQRGFKFDGQSWLPLLEGSNDGRRDFIFCEESYVQRKIAIRTRNHKYIYAPDGVGFCNYCQKVHNGAEELYDLRVDPQEMVNQIEEDPETAAQLRICLDKLLAELNVSRDLILSSSDDDSEPQGDSKDEREMRSIRKKLKSLGYME
jgi:arylsulfatase A-like enzyme